jgi:GntR family transcriptional regulator/MocR family aminotransferase
MWIVEYEPDGAFLGTAAPPLVADDRSRRTIYLGTFDTLLFPQLHIGYCVLPEELAEPFARVLGASAAAPSALTQAVLADFLDDHRSARTLERIRAAARARHGAVREALTRHGLGHAIRGTGPAADSAVDLTLVLPDQATESAVVAAAADASLTVQPLSSYFSGAPTISGLVLGCAVVRDEAVEPSVQALAGLLADIEG